MIGWKLSTRASYLLKKLYSMKIKSKLIGCGYQHCFEVADVGGNSLKIFSVKNWIKENSVKFIYGCFGA